MAKDLQTARKIEELLSLAHSLGKETGFIPESHLKALQMMTRNISRHYHNSLEKVGETK